MDEKDGGMLAKLLRGDKRAWQRFYRGTSRRLTEWVRNRVKNKQDAEEIVQDSYLSFLDSLPIFRSKSSLYTFLVAIAKHEVMDYWRKKYAKRAIKTVPFVDQVYTEKLYSSTQTAVVIRKVYRKLLPEQARILKMKYEEGMSIKQIAGVLKVTVKAAESRLFRARRAFQLAYEMVEVDSS